MYLVNEMHFFSQNYNDPLIQTTTPPQNLPHVHVIKLNHNSLGIFSNFPEFIHVIWPSQQLDEILVVGDDHQLEVFLTGSRLDDSVQQTEAIGNIW